MSGTFSAQLSVDNLAALKAIANPPDKATRYARDTSAAGDLSREAGWYTFRLGDTSTEALPDIVAPTVGAGRWRAFAGGDGGGGAAAIVSPDEPNQTPEFVGQQWIVSFQFSGETIVDGYYFGVLTSGSLAPNSNVVNIGVGEGAWIALQLRA